MTTLLTQSESYITTYGGDFISYSEGGYVWAQTVRLLVRTPMATASGQIVIGHVQYKQLAAGLTVAQLIRMGIEHPTTEEVSFNVAINNDAMIYDDSTSTSKFATETIGYAIIIQPARSIQNDTNLAFNLGLHFNMNYVFWTDPSNIFTQALVEEVKEESLQVE